MKNKRKRSKPVIYHGSDLKPKPGYKYLRDRNPVQDVEIEQMQDLVKWVRDNNSTL